MVLNILIFLLVLDAVLIVITILLQPRMQGGVGAAFGGAGFTGSLFGGKGGMSFLTNLTAVLAVIFLLLILGVNFYITAPAKERTIMKRTGAPATRRMPTTSGEEAPQQVPTEQAPEPTPQQPAQQTPTGQ